MLQSICITVKVYSKVKVQYWFAIFTPSYVAIACYIIYVLWFYSPRKLFYERKTFLVLLLLAIAIVDVILLSIYMDQPGTISLKNYWLATTIMIGVLCIYCVFCIPSMYFAPTRIAERQPERMEVVTEEYGDF
ncbi:MAG: hypothetical protein JSS82_12545 [Bacteroidetes bacterium]|nr:hypothetical protein [Bacteroidota bacterium]